MKSILAVYFLFAIFAQDTNLTVGTFISPISAIINRLLDTGTNLLNSVIYKVNDVLHSLESTINNLISRVTRDIYNLTDNLLSLIDERLTKAQKSDKVVDDCIKRVAELERLKSKISNAVDQCKKKLNSNVAKIIENLKEEKYRGDGVISSLSDSLFNCPSGIFTLSCITKSQKSSLEEIQGIVDNTEIIGEKIYLTSDAVTKCITDVEEDGRQSANAIYLEIELCISKAPSRRIY